MSNQTMMEEQPLTNQQVDQIRALGMIADMRYQIELNVVGLEGIHRKVKDSGLKKLTVSFVENQKLWGKRIDEKIRLMGFGNLMKEDLESVDFGYYSDIMDSARMLLDSKNVSYLLKEMTDIKDLTPYMDEIRAILQKAINTEKQSNEKI